MKKSKLLILTLLFGLLSSSIAFGQMKIQPKTIVIVLGPKNPTLDEANFPDLNFYYTPNLVLNVSEKASKNTNKKAWSSALGVGRTSKAEGNDSYTGTPAEIVNREVHSGFTVILDKQGLINAKTFSGERVYFNKSTKFLLKFNKMKREWESAPLPGILKDMNKKGNILPKEKKSRKAKAEPTHYVIGKPLDNFEVVDSDGNSHNMNSITQGNTSTLVLFLRINPDYDLKRGKESGEGKKGRAYMNQVAQTAAADKQIEPLYNLEKGIFGKKKP